MKGYLFRLLNHEELSREEMKSILIGITHSEYPNEQITALLTCLQMRGVTVDELLGFRDGILETGVPAILHADRYIDVVGTGGDRKNTFNISTTACFVIAGAGYKVAKHGNYSATSVSGASNVIQHHGIKFTDDIDHLNRSLDEAGIVYLHAQLFAKAMKFVGPIRKALPFPTIFNLLGPIVNPSRPKCQLLGVANLDQMRLYHAVYQRLGIDYGIVNSIDGYDEISLTGDFKVTVGTGSAAVGGSLADTSSPSPLAARLVELEMNVLRLAGLAPDFSALDHSAERTPFAIDLGRCGQGSRTVRLAPATAAALSSPCAPSTTPSALADAVRFLGLFLAYHLETPPDVRRALLLCTR